MPIESIKKKNAHGSQLDNIQVEEKKLRTAEEDEFERRRNSPCIVCEKDNDWDTLYMCDGCDEFIHTYCCGLPNLVPEHVDV
jgi:hypothetical protein